MKKYDCCCISPIRLYAKALYNHVLQLCHAIYKNKLYQAVVEATTRRKMSSLILFRGSKLKVLKNDLKDQNFFVGTIWLVKCCKK
jgi:hypothetical protein